MLIDWFTVVAQTLNFLILVWLLRRFLYKPILDAVDAREKRIAAQLTDADTRMAEANKHSEEFQRKNSEFDGRRAALLAEAAGDANTERQRLLDEARKAADAQSAQRRESLVTDAQNLSQAIRLRTQREVFAIARKTLADLADASLEQRMIDVFTRRLRDMEEPAKAILGGALKAASDPALIRSAFDLSTERRAAIQNALNETFSSEIPIRFETDSDLVSGIELTTNGQKVAWSMRDYLDSLESGVAELLTRQESPASETLTPPALVPKG